MLCAITYVTMVVGRIPIILFLKYDPSDVIVTLGGFIWGPMTSCIVSVIVATLEMIALVRHIHGAENDVVMQMALVNVSGNHIGVLALQHFIGKLPPDLMGLLRRGFPRFKGLYQVVGQIVAFLVRLI